MIRILVLLLLPFVAQAEPVRVASFNAELGRKGPGLLLRDIRHDDPQVQAVIDVLTATAPDVLALQGIDWDHDNLALSALADRLRAAGLDYPHLFAGQPNSGLMTSLDLDGDGERGGPGDAQGWGRFTGNGGLAVLSRYPIAKDEVRDLSALLWKDLPGATLPTRGGLPFPSEQAHAVQRLSSTAHWIVPVETPQGRLNLMTFHATPPVFDGPEDRNGLRNRDEIRLWSVLLDGGLGPAPKSRFIIAGDANLDPSLGEGRNEAIRDLLQHPSLQDPRPVDGAGSAVTVVWKAVGERRVDYLLPSVDWVVENAGIRWTDAKGAPLAAARKASRHRLIWVDLSHPDMPPGL
ncbi:endonuclease/exonuclease/phosphatase family protein [Ruegeria sp. B32]|uniref:endonuclease/exonuclease/phosphatase family protein n=1 Tax=Ruegeria sp. B32 TaxID=2867020 RepID=UPI0021A4AD5F|nr:endonuclease/exonuclease/phosphatase family protein [Ruegeria sp. B32]UWR07306.1 endonuclease/exonuclease/phosphatase family protein [Ruegeria sp. B32]